MKEASDGAASEAAPVCYPYQLGRLLGAAQFALIALGRLKAGDRFHEAHVDEIENLRRVVAQIEASVTPHGRLQA